MAQQDVINVNRQPVIGKGAAKKAALKAIDEAQPVQDEPALVVYAGGKKPVLAWEALVQRGPADHLPGDRPTSWSVDQRGRSGVRYPDQPRLLHGDSDCDRQWRGIR